MQRVWLTRALLSSELLTWNHFGTPWACRPPTHAFKITWLHGGEAAGRCYCERHDMLPRKMTVTHLLDPQHGQLAVPAYMLHDYRMEGRTLRAPPELRVRDIVIWSPITENPHPI